MALAKLKANAEITWLRIGFPIQQKSEFTQIMEARNDLIRFN
jgi:hypothetical protein